MKGGITNNGEESQGREEEGRQEAVTSLLNEKKGAIAAPFSLSTRDFLLQFVGKQLVGVEDEDPFVAEVEIV